MKRLATVLGILILIGVIATPVLARGPRRGGGHPMMGYRGNGSGYCRDFGQGTDNLSDKQRPPGDGLYRKYHDENKQVPEDRKVIPGSRTGRGYGDNRGGHGSGYGWNR